MLRLEARPVRALALVGLLAAPAKTPTPVYGPPSWKIHSLPDPAKLRARCAKFTYRGAPVVEAQLLSTGVVGKIRTIQSCGCPAGDELLRDTIRAWTFIPATRNGKPVDVSLTLSVNHYWW